jgi:hypothetical protein
MKKLRLKYKVTEPDLLAPRQWKLFNTLDCLLALKKIHGLITTKSKIYHRKLFEKNRQIFLSVNIVEKYRFGIGNFMLYLQTFKIL